uniref:copper-binding protein n=2 Tax=Pseudoduganella sp. OTU4001 TaxID=3043854 RepID=UPI00313D740B
MKSMTNTLRATALVCATLMGAPALAQHSDHDHAAHSAPAAAADTTDGEIKKVDKEAKKLTIKHGELKNMGMGAMTMVFRVKDPAMLEKVKAGDKVKFTVEKVNGALTVTALDGAK